MLHVSGRSTDRPTNRRTHQPTHPPTHSPTYSPTHSIPGYCYASSFKHPHFMRKVAWAQLVFGLIIGPSSVAIILLDAAGLL